MYTIHCIVTKLDFFSVNSFRSKWIFSRIESKCVDSIHWIQTVVCTTDYVVLDLPIL